ncbi:hypothetical protein F2P81_017483 [Scophthalmus maximus]|uniref:Uncharacterized protein n=1 Tax=Scophthalmus maximus TaxID=52904 RepID=A0A6A4SK62_SCOMX|nr:hypothetical protein F2P81_017483 [Scophthalmus maximus]
MSTVSRSGRNVDESPSIPAAFDWFVLQRRAQAALDSTSHVDNWLSSNGTDVDRLHFVIRRWMSHQLGPLDHLLFVAPPVVYRTQMSVTSEGSRRTALVEGEMTAKRPELLSVRPMNASTHPVSINPSIDAVLNLWFAVNPTCGVVSSQCALCERHTSAMYSVRALVMFCAPAAAKRTSPGSVPPYAARFNLEGDSQSAGTHPSKRNFVVVKKGPVSSDVFV